MTTGNTTLLGLALPVQGDLDGEWGTVVNTSITSLVDSAIAGTTTLSTNTDVTLTTTVLAANQARQAVLLWTASNGATTRSITAPAQSKPYIVINAGTGSIVLRGAGPTTGVIIISGEKCLAAWDGSDFVKVATSTGVSTISFGTTGLTPSTATEGAVTVAGTLAVANGGTGVTTSTGTGNVVRSTSPTLVTPVLGTPTSVTLTNATGLPLSTGVTGTLAVANGGTGVTASTGTGSVVLSTSPTLVTPVLGVATGTSFQGIIGNVTPAAGTFTSLTSSSGAAIQGLTVGKGATAPVSSTAVGVSALASQTSNGIANTAVGYQALTASFDGSGNTAVGYQALTANTDGLSNVAVGSSALTGNLIGQYNVAVGVSALAACDNGNQNTAVGYQALDSVITGGVNTAIGSQSGSGITNGNYNVVIGGYTGSGAPISATGSNWIVLSDGQANVRQVIDPAGNAQFLASGVVQYAPAPTSISAAATLTNASIQAQLIVTTGTSYTIRMPVGTTLETLISWAGVDLGYDFSIVNTASGTITLDATETGVTGVGTMTVLTGISARFRIRRTAANTFIVYRIS